MSATLSKPLSVRLFLAIAAMVLFALASIAKDDTPPLPHQDIVSSWDQATPPPLVELTPVALNPRHSALLVLDIEERTCNEEQRPRCVASVPKIEELLKHAREQEMLVIYSLTPKGSLKTILPPVEPLAGEPLVQSSVDKFYNTDLEGILRQAAIDTVVIVGTAAEGAVLHTATAAAMRGFKVVVVVDGISSADLYAEQYTAWHMLNAPGTRNKAVLTRVEKIRFI